MRGLWVAHYAVLLNSFRGCSVSKIDYCEEALNKRYFVMIEFFNTFDYSRLLNSIQLPLQKALGLSYEPLETLLSSVSYVER